VASGQGQTPVRRHAIGAPDASDNDQVRRWRRVFNEAAGTPGAGTPGLRRTIGVAQAAEIPAAADGFCIRTSEISRMFHPASVGVSGAMESRESLKIFQPSVSYRSFSDDAK
jgi:hypothetical protein